jgi:hypothetical protein
MAVNELQISSRAPFAKGVAFGDAGPFEELTGTVRFAVDPDHPANELITDLKLVPRERRGRVAFSADFRMLRPVEPQRGNHRILLDVLNRGRPRALKYFNSADDDPDASAPFDPGNGFLMRQGYTVVWCGWQHDVPDTQGLMRINVPGAVTSAGPISGKLVVTLQPNTSGQVQLLSDRMHRPYPANDLNDPEAVLTVQDHDYAPSQVIPRNQWSFARADNQRVVPDGRHVYLEPGFEPGKVYRVIYTTTGAPVAGMGLLATRDIVSFFRYEASKESNPCAGDIQHTLAFGASQSGRFLRHFLYLALNQDEEDRPVFDGLIAHIAGGRRGEFNLRFGQPSRVIEHSVGSLFPFADTEQTDSDTGRSDGLLSKLASRGALPKVFFTNTSSEYWGGHGALTHTDLSGERDIQPLESVRIYHYAGTQHGSATFPLSDSDPATGSRGRYAFNCVDYVPLLRAALVRLDRWISQGEAPPPSQHPRIDDGTAVSPEHTAPIFRAIPGVEFPTRHRYLSRLDFGLEEGVATKSPAQEGKSYPNLVSAVDLDGNELGGIRLPDLTAPLATQAGWNIRHHDTGGPGQTLRMIGSTIPFPATRSEREALGDPRVSIEERYPTRDDYLEQVRREVHTLVDAGYVLAEDMCFMIEEAGQRYDLFRTMVRAVQASSD